MKPGPDPVENLQAAWLQVRTPPFERPLEEEDETTQAAVALLQRAWSRLEAPPAPRQPRRGRGGRWHGLRRAAGLLLLLLPALALLLARREAGSSDAEAALEARSQSGPEVHAPVAPPGPPPMEVLDNRTPGRLVLRSGTVRLTLIQPAS